MMAHSVIWLLLISTGASILGGVLGMASGIFIVPALVNLAGLDLRSAIVASIISVIACSCGGAAPFLRERLTNVRIAVVLEVATTLGALTGVLMMGTVPVPALFLLFSAILLISAYQMGTRRVDQSNLEKAPAKRWSALSSTYPDREGGQELSYHVDRLGLGLAFMYGAGLISALLGIGSGVLKIPAMDSALRLPIKVSSATSNFMIGVTAAASGAAYMARGLVQPAIVGPVALGSVAGALIGAWLLIRVPAARLRLSFAGILVLLAVQMALQGLGVHLGTR
jgi:uncharacterized membrane protein YfcA